MFSANPVLPGLQPYEIGLLNAIASRESGGRYDVRYTPQGTATFQGFAQHPGIYEQGPAGPSSAAGRYQFVKQTWDGLPAEAKGDGSFSPANQDRAALWLARRDYQARTGQDLDQVLQTDGFTPAVAKTLAPTWTGLGQGWNQVQSAYNNGLSAPAGLLGSATASQQPAPAPAAPAAQPQGPDFGKIGTAGLAMLQKAQAGQQKQNQQPAWVQAAFQRGLLG